MMPSLVSRKRLGTLSGIGWAVGYVGGLVSLFLVAGAAHSGREHGQDLARSSAAHPARFRDARRRPADRSVLGALVPDLRPAAVPVHAGPAGDPREPRAGQGRAHAARSRRAGPRPPSPPDRALSARPHALCRRARRRLRLWRHLCRRRVFGWGATELGLFGIILTIAGTIGAALGGLLDDRLGSKRVIGWALVLFILASIGVLSVDQDHILFVLPVEPKACRAARRSRRSASRSISLFAILIGLASGPIQSSSRTLLARLCPARQDHRVLRLLLLLRQDHRVRRAARHRRRDRRDAAASASASRTSLLFLIAGLLLLQRVRVPAR